MKSGEIKRGRASHSNRSVKRDSINSSRRFRIRRSTLAVGLAGVFLITCFLTNNAFSGIESVNAFAESIETFEGANCSTPKTTWDLGQTTCAVGTGAGPRSIAWFTPDGQLAQNTGFFVGTSSDRYNIPASGPFAQVGTWTVRLLNPDGDGIAVAKFVVRNPAAARSDLSIVKLGPDTVSPGETAKYTVLAVNRGPDPASNVTITDPTPADLTLVSATQNPGSGPTFTCTNGTCTASQGATLAVDQAVVFTFIYTVSGNAQDGTVITNTARVDGASPESDPRPSDNASTVESIVVNRAPGACTINCPSEISRNNDPDQCSAIVTYATPTISGNCADPETGQTSPVTCSPPSGSSFPIGSTPVVCSSGGNGCSFTVTVVDTRPPATPTITCPADVTVDEQFPGAGSATVNYSAPAATGNCVTSVCSPPSGSTFPVGSTTVTCVATDSSENTVSCSFIVTVSGGGSGCTINCPQDITQTASPGQCSAVVSYASPTTSGSCGVVTCGPQQSGDTFPVGVTTITCTSDQGPSCSFTITVVPSAAPTIERCASDVAIGVNSECEARIPNLLPDVVASGCAVTLSQSPAPGTVVGVGLTVVTITAENSAGEATCTVRVTVGPQLRAVGPAAVWVGLKNSDDVGTRFDLLAEVLRNGEVVAIGQIEDVAGGSSGFNNAVLSNIQMKAIRGAGFCRGDTIGFRLSVRISAGSRHRSGTARLWFNDEAAGSRFSATVGDVTSNNFLVTRFGLATTVGFGPKNTVDVLVDRAVGGNPFKPFGTWSRTF